MRVMTSFDHDLMSRPGETVFQWARRTGMYSELRICSCCMVIEANGDPCGDDDCGTCRPGGLYEQSVNYAEASYTLGAVTDECGHNLDDQEDCNAHAEDCENFGFMHRGCDMCGSPLHGDKYAAIRWPAFIPEQYTTKGN
jgi:hypothetical protein